MLSPQIYIANFDKTLTFKQLDYTSHKVSSLVIAGTKAKARKGTKQGWKEGKRSTQKRGRKERKTKSKKCTRKKWWYDRKNDNFCNMQSWELSCFSPHLKNQMPKRWRWLIDLIMKYRYGSQVENRDAAYLTAMDFWPVVLCVVGRFAC